MPSKINILYVSHFGTLRMGGQRSMTHLIENLDRERFQPYAICPEPGELSEKLESIGCPCFFMPLYSIKPKNYLKVLPIPFKIRKLIKEYNIDIVHPDFTADTFFCGLAKLGTKAKMVWHVRWTEKFAKDRIHERLADGIIGVSDAAGRRFTGNPKIGEKYRTIYNGVDCALFSPIEDKSIIRQELGLPNDKFILLFAGVLKPGKGIFDLVEAMSILKKNIIEKEKNTSFLRMQESPSSAAKKDSRFRGNDNKNAIYDNKNTIYDNKNTIYDNKNAIYDNKNTYEEHVNYSPAIENMPLLLFVGTTHSESISEQLISEINKKGLTEDIRVFPAQKNIEQWMQASDALAIPSHEGNEGMPRVLCEALACGIVGIGSDTSGVNEAITQDTGILVKEKSPLELALAIKKLIENPTLVKVLQINGRKRALEHFDIKKHARNVEDFYMEVLKG